MDQWHVVSEGRWDGVLVLTVRECRAHAYRTVPYYDEFTEQSVFKAVVRGNTDPRSYCMGCGVDEGELHEHWCHAVKEANRKKAAHRHSAMAHNHSEWAFQSCKTGNWHRALFKHGEFALCPGCKMHVKEPERPPAPEKAPASPKVHGEPGADDIVLATSKGQHLELKQPSAVAQAKAFHLRPPRREIVVLVDDMSEPP